MSTLPVAPAILLTAPNDASKRRHRPHPRTRLNSFYMPRWKAGTRERRRLPADVHGSIRLLGVVGRRGHDGHTRAEGVAGA